MLAAVAEPLLRPRRLDHLHPFLEQLPVASVGLTRHLVVAARHRSPEGLRLAGYGPPSDAEHRAPAGEDVGHGEVLSQAQRVPLGHHVEHLPEAELGGDAGQVHPEEDQVGSGLIALVLEVVLGQPEGVIAEPVGSAGPVTQVLVAGDDIVVAETPVGGSRRAGAGVGHGHRRIEVKIDLHPTSLLAVCFDSRAAAFRGCELRRSDGRRPSGAARVAECQRRQPTPCATGGSAAAARSCTAWTGAGRAAPCSACTG